MIAENLCMLAQTTEQTTSASITNFVPIELIWEQITQLSWVQAVMAISFGAVYMLYGCKIFRVLVVITFAMIGMIVGIKIGEYSGYDQWNIWGGVIGAVLLGLLSIPLMRWAVSLLGALAGAIITSAAWYAFGLPDNYLILAGALVGFIAGGMISFIIFDAAVVLFTSLGGGALVVVGFLSLLWHYEATTEQVYGWVHNLKWFLPSVLGAITALGIIIQRKTIKLQKE